VSTFQPFQEFKMKELVASLGIGGGELTALTRICSQITQTFLRYGMTLVEANPLAQLEDGTFVALDAHMDMEEEARDQQKALLAELGVGDDETRQARPPTPFELRGAEVDASDHRGVAGRVVEFEGNLGCVIGAGGGSLTIFDALRKHGGRPANYCEIGGNPSVKKAAELTKLILSKPGVEKICVIMNVVSNTRVDIVARGVIKGVVESGYDPAEKIAIFRIPGSWEDEGFKILERYGVEFCDRTVPMSEAARRAVQKVAAG
jgi:succinyl-CoA synthetase beta subunit/citryl-CoA synthetase large subunit